MITTQQQYGTVSVEMYKILKKQVKSVYFDASNNLIINILTKMRQDNDYSYIGENGNDFYVGLKIASFTGFSPSSIYKVCMYVSDAT